MYSTYFLSPFRGEWQRNRQVVGYLQHISRHAIPLTLGLAPSQPYLSYIPHIFLQHR